MGHRVSREEVLNKAYRLAYFLHQNKGVAIQIVAAATLKLNVAMAVQSKRLYYIPVGRFSRGESRRTDGIRNKALFSDLHLLQRLIYGESEPYERQKERAAVAGPPGVPADGDPANDADLLVYFIKHLVRITTKRNAFYVTLGVSRLLHSYSTSETMEIYNAVIGEPERVKDDYYYRSRKAVLMHEMCQRFGQLIRACRQRRGEERFETQPGSSEQRSLVRECLRLFTPWDTQGPVPRDFDPFKSVIASLISKNGAEENEVEVSRIHAVLHPDCFERLVAAFGYCPPAKRIELPRFFLDQTDDQSPPRQRSAPAELSAEELAEINHTLHDEAGRRRRAAPGAVLRVIVDGVERGRLDPSEQSSISFSADEDAELIEVKTMDARGELLLATHLLTSFEKDEPYVFSIRLEGGQDLSLSITRRESDADRSGGLLVKFGYRETALGRVVRLWWQRLNVRRSLSGGTRISPRYVFVGSIVVVMCLVSYLGYVRLRSRQTGGPPTQTSVAQATPSAVAAQASPPIDKINEPVRTASPPARASDERSTAVKAPSPPRAITPTQAPEESIADDVTRSGVVVPNLTLKEVRKVYLDLRGDVALDELRRDLVESLRASNLVTATTNADDADASLKIVISPTRAGDTQPRAQIEAQAGAQIEASARLVNARGIVLWPKAGRGARRYSGDASRVLSAITTNLLAEIRSARNGH